jgi:hypothetical protein
VIIPSQRRTLVLASAAIAACVGAAAAAYYHQLGLTLSHYDARAHLVVARRIFDSITPGWQQIGGVWLPMPHLLNALPVQIDFFYRTGFSAVALSIAAFAASTGAIAWIVAASTGSTWAAGAATLVFALNPNVLYLQSTPMTEVQLLALTLIALALLVEWCRARGNTSAATAGVFLALACLTRYEAWPIAVTACLAAVWARWRAGDSLPTAVRAATALAVYPAAAIIGFLIFGRVVTGTWFVHDFYVADNVAQNRPFESIKQVVWGVRALSGSALVIVAAIGIAVAVTVAIARRHQAFFAVPLAMVAGAAIAWSAFLAGHPYRIRYMVPLLAAEAVFAGIAAGFSKRLRQVAVPILLGLVLWNLRPLDASAPMVAEAQWDRPNVAARDRVTGCLASHYRGETVMVSFGSLSHYVQDLSRNGFRIRDFLHEGNGDIWLNALNDPRPFVGWILIEELAEGGDMLATRARKDPAFLAGFSRTCEAAGLVLYRRNPIAATEDARRR